MLRGAVSKFQRWQYRNGRPGWSARVANRLGALAISAGLVPGGVATLEVRGHKSGRLISFPVVVADYQGERYLVAMLGHKTNWVRNLRGGDGRAVLRRGKPEDVALVEDFSDDRGRSCAVTSRWHRGRGRFSRSTSGHRSRISRELWISIRSFGSPERAVPAPGSLVQARA
jgi:hypothetical protein